VFKFVELVAIFVSHVSPSWVQSTSCTQLSGGCGFTGVSSPLRPLSPTTTSQEPCVASPEVQFSELWCLVWSHVKGRPGASQQLS
jgi:hypothetical protein